MERFFRNPHTIQQNRRGPLGPYIDDFAQLLSEQRYTRECARRRLRLIAEFSLWLWDHRLTLGDITVANVNRFLRSRARRRPVGYSSAACLKAFFELLHRKGAVAVPFGTVEKTPFDEILGGFSLYLQQERALALGTIANYLLDARKFLVHRFKTGPIDLSNLTVAQVIESVQHLALSVSRKRAKVMTSALRAFLRYARYQDLIRSNLAAGVPAIADWSVASIPKGLPPEHVKRTLAACDQSTSPRHRRPVPPSLERK